jgi:hypothetical protein
MHVSASVIQSNSIGFIRRESCRHTESSRADKTDAREKLIA